MSLIKVFVFSSILLFFVIPNVACIRLSHKAMESLWIYNPELAEQISNFSFSRFVKWS
jgi:hypothetical protein